MDITWLGHSCFRIVGNGVTILTDPFPPHLGLPHHSESPSIVTVSNSHPNHSYIEGPEGRLWLLTRPGEYEIGGAHIKALRTPLREGVSLAPRNIVFLMEVDDVVVCHLGDLGAVPTSRLVEELSQTHVLLIPAGGGCTLEVSQAAETVNLIQPRVVIPMHYHVPGLAAALGPVEPFLREMGIGAPSPMPRLSVTAASLPHDTQVALMEVHGG